ncbi:HSF-type DNA-binding-domain-containing protein [Mycena filopes]|nr:HSF-type DNA-binding-domain-containing protein [Mycena filopes]
MNYDDNYTNRQWQQQNTHYPPFQFNQQHTPVHRSSSSLSLNLSSLTVASPTNLSPIGPGPPSSALPATPISPATYGNHLHPAAFQFGGAADEHDQQQYDSVTVAVPHSPRSTTSTLPRKRSFSSDPMPSTGSRAHTPSGVHHGGHPPAGYDDMDMGIPTYSPVDGSSGSGDDHPSAKLVPMTVSPPMGVVLGKPMATNNFVTKLYQMITDAKSSHFIAWTEMGTSFVVSNVGEFSRSILGSHFKHNNFSSFVRQLNMYGFHKINRTPRAQRTTSDAQTWEFSHHKFLRGRPDLLDEIKRKALEPDPAVKHRVELPGEVAAQLGAMREENMRVYEQLAAERRRVEKLVGLVGRLWDVVGKGFPGSVPPFPMDLLEPNIYVTSPRGYDPPPNPPPSSTSEYHHHPHNAAHSHAQHSHSHSLSRQQSFQHMSASSPLPASPGSITMEMFGGPGSDDGPDGSGGGRKRQRMIPHPHHASSVDSLSPPKPRTSRARSDSAPLGYAALQQPGGGLGPWGATNTNTGGGGGGGGGRPRSGSGMAHYGHGQGQRGMPNIGGMGGVRGPASGGASVPSNAPSR